MREIDLHNLNEEQLIALMTAALAITEQTNIAPEQVLREIKCFSKRGLLKVMERRTQSGRLEVGFQLMNNGE